LKKIKCIFLDRDGTLNKALKKTNSNKFKLRPPYQIDEFKIYKDLYFLNYFKNNYSFIIISNQPDLVSGEQSFTFHNYINNEIKKLIPIKEAFFCICLPKIGTNCKCYKPNKFIIQKLISKFNISIKDSYIIGDTWRDIKMANNVNMKSILIDRGYYNKLKNDFIAHKAKPNFIIKDFKQLKNIIKIN